MYLFSVCRRYHTLCIIKSIIKPAVLLLSIALFQVSAYGIEAKTLTIPQEVVSGTVQSEAGEPLIGATIVEKGTSNGTITDIEGNFTLDVNPDATLIISYLGYLTQEVAVNGQSTLTITLSEDATSLDEVVVTAYGTSNKRSFTGSAKKVETETLTRTANPSFEAALQGNVTGVNVYASGQPGGSSNVQIRGISSINGLTQPLYVLDGVVINTDNASRIGGSGAVNQINPLSTINTNDIESITVLKDAAAASLYGSRAANGVIVITTKKGKNGETEINFNSELGLTHNLTQEKMINNQQFKELWQEGQLHQYIQNNENGEYFRVYEDSDLYTQYQNMAQSDYEAIYGTTDTNSDWLDAIYRQGSIQKHSLSASGGSDNTRFFISGEYFNQEGTIIDSDYRRYSGRINLENKAKDWLTLGMNLSIAKSERNTGQYDGDYASGLNPLYMARVLPPAAPIYDPDGYQGIADLPNDIEKNANPIGVIKVGQYANNQFRVRGDVFAELQLLKDLKFKTTFGVDQQTNEESLYDNKEFGAGGGTWNGVLYVAQGEVFQYTSSNLFTYDKKMNKHGFGGLLGFESQVSNMKSINNSGYDILDSELLSSSSIGALWSWTGYSENYALLSYFSNFNYNYDQKYYLAASYRRDGSSRFGEDTRWGDFWSVSGGWIASEEDFFKLDAMNYLKLRASYGTNGNLPPDYYAALAFFNTDGKGYGGSSGLSYGQLANPDLSWELSYSFNIGFDAVVFDKVNFTLEYFSKHTKDLLLNIPVSATTGFANQLQNFGEMKNTGWELSLGYNPITNADFSWNTRLNLSILSNEITRLKSDLVPSYNSQYGQDPTIIKVGESINSFYLREYAGVNETNGLAEYYVLENGKRTDELTTNAEEAGFGIFGDALQDVQGGFYNQFQYKNFSLDFLFTFGIGGKAYDRTAFKRDDDGYAPQFSNTKAQLNPWNPNNTESSVPIRINGNPTFSNDVSTRHLYSADYLKFRNIKLSYLLPRFTFLQGGSVYVQGDNLLLLTKLDDYDPEAVTDGVSFFQVPTVSSVIIGVNLKL
ncbi:SusC/RagA family TonB-linked outer membrane protein [Catalinimonas niigatensis]|uniref:SusC/RagA family TonB-linked outer membrane protein n=1 Tax=Catalinimonas niigatensis TaxID=1397264 RepID=UPI0026664C90|nr:TonB-dependent receptor [Catalinimonas niigatensis]WPP49734.1 TonB-dependent receptor [Catalinimonas niigatensis]